MFYILVLIQLVCFISLSWLSFYCLHALIVHAVPNATGSLFTLVSLVSLATHHYSRFSRFSGNDQYFSLLRSRLRRSCIPDAHSIMTAMIPIVIITWGKAFVMLTPSIEQYPLPQMCMSSAVSTIAVNNGGRPIVSSDSSQRLYSPSSARTRGFVHTSVCRCVCARE